MLLTASAWADGRTSKRAKRNHKRGRETMTDARVRTYRAPAGRRTYLRKSGTPAVSDSQALAPLLGSEHLTVTVRRILRVMPRVMACQWYAEGRLSVKWNGDRRRSLKVGGLSNSCARRRAFCMAQHEGEKYPPPSVLVVI